MQGRQAKSNLGTNEKRKKKKKILAITKKGLKEKSTEKEKNLEIGARQAEWKEYYDANSGKNYYYNKTTRTTQWEKPSGVVFR